ncbi:hypothetical protein KKF47_00680 [Patescibacteria group bacterium]|nr:hypothetical protein [Patescibacteria group bacterium]
MKNSFLKKYSLLIKVLVSIFIVAGLVLPLHQAQAWIGALAANIAFSGIAVILELVVLYTSAILFICRLLLVIAISPSLITVPYTSGGIVDVGWPIVRDFANLGFTLALVFIGLATALQLDEYGAKKALPRLLAMALLVNFTPVIAGIIVDASNIIMNFFLGATGDFTAITNLGGSHYSSTLNKLGGSWGKSISLEIIAEAATISIFNLLAGFFFLLYAFLFLTRYVAIWALVIVSPLAFFANVFPKASSYYKQWWQQFIQWCFIGVPASFFLYLSWHLLDQADAIIIAPAPSAWSNFVGIGPILSSMLVYGVVLIFLFLGFLTSLSSGAIGATAIIATAKGLGKSAVGSWKKGTGAIGQAKKGTQRIGREVLSSETIGGKGGLIDQMAGSKSWVGRQLALKAKELKAGIPSGIDDLMKDKTLTSMVKNDDLTGAMLWANDPLHIANRDQRMVAVLAKISEEKGDVGLFKTRQADPSFERKAKQAAVRLSPDHLRRIVSDNPSSAMDDIVWKHFLTKPGEEKGKLAKIQGRLNTLAEKDRTKLNESDKWLDNDLSRKFGTDWRTSLGFGRTTKDIIRAGETDNGYQALGQLWSLEKTVRGLDMDAVTKLSPETMNNPVIQDIFARDKNVNHLAKIDEKFGPEVSSKFTYDAIERIGAENLAIDNPQMLRAPFMLNQQAFPPSTNPETKKPFADLKEVNDFIARKKGRPGPGPGPGGPGPEASPTPPSPVSGAPRFVQTPSGLAVPAGKEASRKMPPPGGQFSGSPAPPPPPVNDVVFKGQTGYTYTQSIIDYSSHKSGARGVIPGGKQIGNHPYQDFKHPLTGQQMIRRTDDRIKSKLEFYVDGKKVNLRMSQEIPVDEHLVIKDRGKTINF